MGLFDGIGRQAQRAGLMNEANFEARSLVAKMQTGYVDGNDVAFARRIINEVSAAQPPWGANGFEQYNWQRNMNGALALYTQVSQMYQAEMGGGINPSLQSAPQYAPQYAPEYAPAPVNPGYVDPGYATPGYVDPGSYNQSGANFAEGAMVGAGVVGGLMLLNRLTHNDRPRYEQPHYEQPRYDNRRYEARRYEPVAHNNWGNAHDNGWRKR